MISGQPSQPSGDQVSADLAFDVAHALAPVQATQLDGKPIRIGTLWEQRAAVLVFLRHFG
jgi:hypothetical protein